MPPEAAVRLMPATIGDFERIRRWLAREDIQRWWGPQAATEAAVLTALGDRSAICRLVHWNGGPVGYAQAIDAAAWGSDLPDELAPGTWDLDIFIAEEACRGRGIGAAALRLLGAEVFATTLAPAVCIFAAVDNERAVRAYERAGFKWRRIWHDPPHRPEWFMVLERPHSPASV
jgi:aminoglycoside 6'-N-acetyltransferase